MDFIILELKWFIQLSQRMDFLIVSTKVICPTEYRIQMSCRTRYIIRNFDWPRHNREMRCKARSPRDTKREPKDTKRRPKGNQGDTKRRQGRGAATPRPGRKRRGDAAPRKGAKRDPKGSQKGAKREPKGTKTGDQGTREGCIWERVLRYTPMGAKGKPKGWISLFWNWSDMSNNLMRWISALWN